MLVAIDDAHALDRPSLEILLDGTRCPGNRFALLIATRPFGPATTLLDGRTDVRAVRVPPLGTADARAILTRDLDPEIAAQQARLVDWAVDLANGNPFFLVELSGHCRSRNAGNHCRVAAGSARSKDRGAVARRPAGAAIVCCSWRPFDAWPSRGDAWTRAASNGSRRCRSSSAAGLIAFRDRTRCSAVTTSSPMRCCGASTASLGSYLHRRCAGLLTEELRISPSASLAWDCARHWDAADEPTRAWELTSADRRSALGVRASEGGGGSVRPRGAVLSDAANSMRSAATPQSRAPTPLRLGRSRQFSGGTARYSWPAAGHVCRGTRRTR